MLTRRIRLGGPCVICCTVAISAPLTRPSGTLSRAESGRCSIVMTTRPERHLAEATIKTDVPGG